MVFGMHDDNFAEGTECERCGSDYHLAVVRLWRGLGIVEVCPICDLGAVPLSAGKHPDQ
jgi:hypothetical protein